MYPPPPPLKTNNQKICFLFFTILLCGVVAVSVINKQCEPHTKCEPIDIYFRWSEVRRYLTRNLLANIPDVYYGTTLKVRRCLYFMTPCNVNEELCVTAENAYNVGTITLTSKSDNKTSGYCHVLFVEDNKCECTNQTKYVKERDLPWDLPPFIDYEFVKIK